MNTTMKPSAETSNQSRRRRRSSDPYFALWSLCTSVSERPGVHSATVIDDFFNVIASAGDPELAGIAVWNSRMVSSDDVLSLRVMRQARSLDDSYAHAGLTRRYAFVSPQRDAFQVLIVADSESDSCSIAEGAVAAVHRILSEHRNEN